MATTTRSLTLPGDGTAAAHPCPCGCASCEGTCCSLDCLVQPRFFCGQLLTDQDLTALVSWVRDKFGLSRYREGWGVVCGLDVHCASDRKHPLRVAVTPGYAVGCCGDDIIVCQEATLDLADACREEADPCADLRKQLRGTGGAAPAGTGTIRGNVTDGNDNPIPLATVSFINKATNTEQRITADSGGRFSATIPAGLYRVHATLPGFGVMTADNVRVAANATTTVSVPSEGGAEPVADGDDDEDLYRVVDIYLRYAEKPSAPMTAMGRSACKEVAECEYSRTQESYTLTWQFGQLADDPVQAAAQRWHKGYEQCLDVLKQFNLKFPFTTTPRGEDVRRWLMEWMERHPLSHFCHLRDEICTASTANLTDQVKLIEWLFGFVQDCRNAYLNCSCAGCESDAGVPLARVWLKSADEHWGRENCRIIQIDPYPPFRRPLKQDCWLAPLGSVNVGRAIWHRRQEACTMLRDLGVRIRREQRFTLPATLAELEEQLSCDLFVACGQERDLLYYDLGPLGERVVGFCTDTGPPPPPAPAMEAEKTGPPRARLNESVNYAVNVTNTGNVELQVRVEENGHSVAGTETIPAGESAEFVYVDIIPDNATGTYTNRAVVIGETSDHQQITRDVQHTLDIEQTRVALAVDVECSTNQANVGDIVTYSYIVQNTGNVDLQNVDLDSTVAPPPQTLISLLRAGQTLPTMQTTFRVPANAGDMIVNTFRGQGHTAAGQLARDDDSHTLSVSFGNFARATPPAARSSDDFTVISGIGEARASTLSEAGIRTYTDLAASSVEQLKEILPGISEGTLKQWMQDAKKLARS